MIAAENPLSALVYVLTLSDGVAPDVGEHVVLLRLEVGRDAVGRRSVEAVLADGDDDRILLHHHDVAAGLALDDVFGSVVGFEDELLRRGPRTEGRGGSGECGHQHQ